MLITKADLYLPISENMLRQIIKGGADNVQKTISSLNAPQIASLLLLQKLSEMNNTQSTHPERFLAEKINFLNSRLKKDGPLSGEAELASILDFKNIKEGWSLLPSLRIELLDEEAIRERNYLTSEAKWDYTFNEKHRERLIKSLIKVTIHGTDEIQLTLEQNRIYREISTQIDDHIHVQGYAGTGKSFLIKHLISQLNRKGVQVLILAERKLQIDAIKSSIGQMDHVSIINFASLAAEMIPHDLTNPVNRNMRKRASPSAIMKDEEVINHFGIKRSGGSSEYEIVKAIHITVAAFCYSGDSSIQLSHIPNWCAASLDETTKKIVIHYAEKLWQETLIPTSKDFKPLIRIYHQIKWISLNQWQIPAHYTYILIDECHNLSKSMLQILDRCTQPVISLGDEYQNLQGRSQQRSNNIRHRLVTQSVRSGRLIENIVNPIIGIHPGTTKAPFQGSSFHSIDITYYKKSLIPDKPVAILVNDMWELFEWAQRMASKGLHFTLLANRKDLNIFVNDCIELKRYHTQPRHRELFRFKDWDQVKRKYHDNESFQQIDKLLSKDYQYRDWEKTTAKFKNDSSPYLLGMVEDARNHEFQAVMITPEFGRSALKATHENIGSVGSAIYVAVTRAKQCLIVPETLMNWIEIISAR